MKRSLHQSRTDIARYIYLTCFLSSFVLNTVAQNWQFTQRYTPPDVKASHYFGGAVDIDGNFAIASARSQSSITNADTIKQAGAVYLFKKDAGSNWSETQKLTAPDASAFNYFGIDVGISGTTAVVGAHYNETDGDFKNPIPAAGAVYVFERNQNGIWEFWQKLTAADRDTLDWFGKSLKLQQNQLVIAAPGVDEEGVQAVGSVYYFTKDQNGYWTEQQKITPPDKTAFKEFGTSIAYNKNHMVIGAPFESDTVTNRWSDIKLYQKDYGSAYIYQKQVDGIWAFVQKLISPADYSRFFANSVGVCTLNENETQVLVGHPTRFNSVVNVNGEAGAIFVYTANEYNEWSWTQAVVPREVAEEDAMPKYGNIGSLFVVDSNVLVNGGGLYFGLDTKQNWIKIEQDVKFPQNDTFVYSPIDLALSKNNVIIGAKKHYFWPSNLVGPGAISLISSDIMPFITELPILQQSLIYPNPIIDNMYFNITQFPNLKNIKIVDIKGRQILNQQLFKTPNQLTFKSPPGIYSVIAEDANGNLFNQKIIKTPK